LYGLLLASHVAAFRSRRDESSLDHPARPFRAIGTDCAKGLASIANIGDRVALLRDLVGCLGPVGMSSRSSGVVRNCRMVYRFNAQWLSQARMSGSSSLPLLLLQQTMAGHRFGL
jgi:hypothetical protein